MITTNTSLTIWLIPCIYAALTMSEVPCWWKVSVISSNDLCALKEVPFRNDKELLPVDEKLNKLQVDYMQPDEFTSYFAYPYFLHLNVICHNQPEHQMAQTLNAVGVNPQVSITHRPNHIDQCHDGGQTKYTMTGALLNSGVGRECEQDALLCHPAWVIPLIHDQCSVMVDVHVDTRSADFLVQPTRKMINADGYTMKSTQPETEYESILGTLVDIDDIAALLLQHQQPFKITSIPSATPSLVIGGIGNYVIVTASEFEHYQVIEVSAPTGNTLVCSDTSEFIKQALSLPDRIILNTPSGLYEMFGFYGFLEAASAITIGAFNQVMPAHCVKEIVLSTHTYTEHVVVLAVGVDAGKEMAWVAHAQTGLPLQFSAVIDDEWKSPCDTFTMQGLSCSIISSGIGRVHQTSFIFLLLVKDVDESSKYHLVSIQGHGSDAGNASSWEIRSWFSADKVPITDPGHGHPIQITPIEESKPMVTTNLTLTGLTYTRLVSEHIFMWGNVLLHSPDGGISVYILTQYTSSSDILLVSASSASDFAFFNDQQELWYGIVGSTVELHKLRPSAGWSLDFGTSFIPLGDAVDENKEYILTVFFNHHDELFELVTSTNTSNSKVCVFRRKVLVTDIVNYENFVRQQEMEQVLNTKGTDGAILSQAGTLCPFLSISFEAKISQFNERIQCFAFNKPHLTNPDQIHTEDSLMVYQGIVHQTIKQSLQDKPKGVASLYDPVARWKDSRSVLKDYYEWLYRTKRVTSGIHVPIEEYGKLYAGMDHPHHIESTLPSVIYLELGSFFNFTVHLSLDLPNAHEVALDSLWLTVDVSDTSLIEVFVSRNINYLTNHVQYEVRIHDRGVLNQQALSGLQLHPASILLQVWDSAFKCSQQSDTGEKGLQGSYSMNVLLGCAPGKRLIFDLNSTLEYAISQYGVIYDCPGEPNPDMPCFYYKHDFYPFFQVVDLVTGKAEIFTGDYTFKVIGGSQGKLDELRYFDQREQEIFNLQNNAKDETLIWIPIEGDIPLTNDSAVIFNSERGGVLWSCQQHSSCADVPLRFPYAPEYYFLIEVSNRNVDAARTYCDFTVQFVIRVHGFQISPMRSIRIVLWTFGIFCISLSLFVVYNHNKHHPIRKPEFLKKKRQRKVVPIMVVEDTDTKEKKTVKEYEEYLQNKEMEKILRYGDVGSIDSREEVLEVYEMDSSIFLDYKTEQDQKPSFHTPEKLPDENVNKEMAKDEQFGRELR